MKKVGIIYVIVILLGIIGYGMNIVKLVKCDFKSPYRAEVIRTIGALTGVPGAIIGYIDIND